MLRLLRVQQKDSELYTKGLSGNLLDLRAILGILPSFRPRPTTTRAFLLSIVAKNTQPRPVTSPCLSHLKPELDITSIQAPLVA